MLTTYHSFFNSLKKHRAQVSALLTLVQLFLPGPVAVLYGEELALPSASGIKPPNQLPQRALQQWDSDPNTAGKFSGFSSIDGKLMFPTAASAPGQTFKVRLQYLIFAPDKK